MFPHAQHAPDRAAQRARHERVTSLVADDFFPPPRRPICGPRRMFGAAVPKTTIHKNREFDFPENKIWFAEDGLIAPPAVDAMRPQKYCQRKFRVLVPAPANPRHHL